MLIWTGLMLMAPASGGQFTNPVAVLGHHVHKAAAKMTTAYCPSLSLFISSLHLVCFNHVEWLNITSHIIT
jgi:hypothetical protein